MPGKALMYPVRCTLRTCRWCMDHYLLASVWMSMPSLSEGTAPCHARPSLEQATDCQVSHQNGASATQQIRKQTSLRE